MLTAREHLEGAKGVYASKTLALLHVHYVIIKRIC